MHAGIWPGGVLFRNCQHRFYDYKFSAQITLGSVGGTQD